MEADRDSAAEWLRADHGIEVIGDAVRKLRIPAEVTAALRLGQAAQATVIQD